MLASLLWSLLPFISSLFIWLFLFPYKPWICLLDSSFSSSSPSISSPSIEANFLLTILDPIYLSPKDLKELSTSGSFFSNFIWSMLSNVYLSRSLNLLEDSKLSLLIYSFDSSNFFSSSDFELPSFSFSSILDII